MVDYDYLARKYKRKLSTRQVDWRVVIYLLIVNSED